MLAFSEAARSQVQSPAGLALQEHRGPATLFSDVALSQVQWRADCLPQEQVAFWAELYNVSPIHQVIHIGSDKLTTGAFSTVLGAASGGFGDSHDDGW